MSQKQTLNSFAYFRAIAILFIIAGHAIGEARFAGTDLTSRTVLNLISGWTTCFVFISGYLFHHVFAARFDYGRYMRGKLRNVALPYLVLATPVAVLAVFVLVDTPPADLISALRQVVLRVAVGQVLMAYWYVPFIIAMFLLSPLHMRFLQLSPRMQLAIFAPLLVIGLTTYRAIDDVSPLQSVVVFTPAYLMGMMVSQHRAAVMPMLRRMDWGLLAAAIALAIWQASGTDVVNYHRDLSFSFAGLDLMVAQKMLICLALVSLLDRIESVQIPALHRVADASFGMFFLHPVVLWVMTMRGYQPPTGLAYADLALTFAMVAALSLMLAQLIHDLIPRGRSRLIIGY